MAEQCQHNPPPRIVPAMFAKEYPLPGSQGEPAVTHRNENTAAQDGALAMGRHVIGAFHCVDVPKALRDKMIEHTIEIGRHIRVSGFVDCQRSRGMLEKHMQKAALELAQLRECLDDMPCDGMKSFSEPRQFNFSLNPIYSNHATSLSQSLQNTNALNRSCNSLNMQRAVYFRKISE